jgi:homoserine kinase
VRAEPATEWSVTHDGDQQPEAGSDDAVLAAARLAVGSDRPLRLRVSNSIPIGKGLGSSSAAMAAGALAAWRAVGDEHSAETLFELVADMEGHPDNAAAAVFGGMVLVDSLGVAHRLPWNPRFSLVALVPAESLSTRKARTVLPATYSRGVVVATVARTASLIAGLLAGDSDLVRAAGGDEIHEAPRNAFVPEVAKRIRLAVDAGAVHAAWSGAGPSVLAIVETADLDRVVGHMRSSLEESVEINHLEVAVRGAV